jgi:hypothetical protein
LHIAVHLLFAEQSSFFFCLLLDMRNIAFNRMTIFIIELLCQYRRLQHAVLELW